ncbi:MAG: hypothetical protein EOP52_04865 [Sphingobacteriales bacterium]|nr:MAG: hypothetical protein EOP52_04865 [Sphingobacteriales bacterium]
MFRSRSIVLPLTVLFAAIAGMLYCYPMPQISWDSNYYVWQSVHLPPSVRPIGYALFLRIVYAFSTSIYLIEALQFLLYSGSGLLLIYTLAGLNWVRRSWIYVLLMLVLLEPAGLYSCINILSDCLFSGCTLCYVSSLIAFIRTRKSHWFYLHLAALAACLQLRHIALFYPVPSIVILLLITTPVTRKLIQIGALTLLTVGLYRFDIWRNIRHYNVAVQTPFSGWTQTNNSLFAVMGLQQEGRPFESLNAGPELDSLHRYFYEYLDTMSFQPLPVTTDFLWTEKSPMVQLERAYAPNHPEEWGGWYALADRFSRYGSAFQKQYPLAYFQYFIMPNLSSLWVPHNGEMTDYYLMPHPDATFQSRYGVSDNFHCRIQLFKESINGVQLRWHQLRLLLMVLAGPLVIAYGRRLPRSNQLVLLFLALFIGFYYAAVLYITQVVPRHIIPVLQLETVFIFLTAATITQHFRSKQ